MEKGSIVTVLALLAVAGCVNNYFVEEKALSTTSILGDFEIGGDLLGGSEGTLYIEFRELPGENGSLGKPIQVEDMFVSGRNLDYNLKAAKCPLAKTVREAHSKENACEEMNDCEVKSARFNGSKLELEVSCPVVFRDLVRFKVEGLAVAREGVELNEASKVFIYCENKNEAIICPFGITGAVRIGSN